jgi:hypothetical protein
MQQHCDVKQDIRNTKSRGVMHCVTGVTPVTAQSSKSTRTRGTQHTLHCSDATAAVIHFVTAAVTRSAAVHTGLKRYELKENSMLYPIIA